MTPIRDTFRRLLTLKSTNTAAQDWVVTLSLAGLSVRKKNMQEEYRATWYTLIGFLIVHGKKNVTKGAA